MNLIYLYDEFMRVPAGIEGNPVYIFDDTLTEGYELSDKIIENRYFLAKEAGLKSIKVIHMRFCKKFITKTPYPKL